MESIVNRIYVINMDHDTVRLKEFDTMMKKNRWDYIRSPAVNGSMICKKSDKNNLESELISDLELKQKFVKTNSWLSNNEVGCMLSHVKLWKEVAYNDNLERIAIFEDDARTHTDGDTINNLLTDFYRYLIQNDIDEPDMLYLGKALDDCMNYKRVWGNIYKSRHPLCLHAYIITKKGARELLSMAPYDYAIDVIPIKAIEAKKINVMTFHPSLYFQDIFNNKSNLRDYALNNTTECLVFQQHVATDSWNYVIMVVIALLAAIILFIAFVVKIL